jgi:flavin-dependent dehydrogenase
MAIETGIVVLGGGPAGAAAAIGLARLGHAVTVLASPRPFDACEGISERTAEGLRQAGCGIAASRLGEPVLRHAAWNGIESAANRESLVDRPALDAALLEDMAAAGVEVIAGRAGKAIDKPWGWQVTGKTTAGTDFARETPFLIEARGRAAPAYPARSMGPATTALLQRWRGPAQSEAAAIVPFDSGWAWMARLADGRRYLQFAVSSESEKLPRRPRLGALFDSLVRRVPTAAAWLDDATLDAQVAARSAGAALYQDPVGLHFLRVGDAAIAVDPLSGNGVFQALSTGILAGAVVNTLLRRPENGASARQFYRERVVQSFWRFARIGRDFYRQEQRWPEAPFWAERRAWPDDRPAHVAPGAGPMTMAVRPVVADGFISTREVVVTPDQPLGIWQLDRVELAPLIRRLRDEPVLADEPMKARIARLSGASPRQVETVAAWLWQHLGTPT